MSSSEEENDQAVKCAADQTPRDMIATPIEVTYTALHKKVEAEGEDLTVQGTRWYVQVGLRNVNEYSDEYGTEATALYRVWRGSDRNLKAVRVTLE